MLPLLRTPIPQHPPPYFALSSPNIGNPFYFIREHRGLLLVILGKAPTIERVPPSLCVAYFMRVAGVVLGASALLLLLCCIASSHRPSFLYEPRYPPSNLRQGPQEFSPYSSEGGLPPVYSQGDVSQRNVWSGFDYFQPLYSANSQSGYPVYTPGAIAPLVLAPHTPVARHRYYVDAMMSAIRRSDRHINALQQQISRLQKMVRIPSGIAPKLSNAKRRASLGALSSRVRQLEMRIARLEHKSDHDHHSLKRHNLLPDFTGIASMSHLNGEAPKRLLHHRRIIAQSSPKAVAAKNIKEPGVSRKLLKKQMVFRSDVIPPHSAIEAPSSETRS